MLVTDREGVPLGFHLDSAQRAEVRLAQTTLASIRVAQRHGRPKTRPQELVADKGYAKPGTARVVALPGHSPLHLPAEK